MPVRRLTRLIALTACICSLAGCDAAEQSGVSERSGIVVATDSSGVRITETSAADAPTWSVSELPEVRIGAVEGEEPYLFDRITAAFQLSDGRIVVADGGSRHLRYFSAEGEHIQTVGRQGQGPGEFRVITAVVMTGDSLLVHDLRIGRLTTIGPDGTIINVASVAEIPGLGNNWVLGRISDAEFVFRSAVSLGVPLGYSRDTLSITLGRIGGNALNTLLRLPSSERFTLRIQGQLISGPHPLGPRAVVAVWDGEIVAGTGESHEFGVYDSAGRLQALLRRSDAEIVPLRGSAALEEYIDVYTAAGYPAEDILGRLDRFPGPRFVPAYSRFLVDDLGLLWVGDFVPSGGRVADSRSLGWTVFERSGRVVARVVTPQGFQPLHISEEFIIGRVRDEANVEYVSVYRFRRTGPGSEQGR